MQVKCWNCGTELEKRGEAEYKSALLKVMENLYETHMMVGDKDKAEAYGDVIYVIKNFD